MRFFIEFSYNGYKYHGWQVQPNSITVQSDLNNALSTLLKEKIDTFGAGRTDACVHAKIMYAHFDYKAIFDTKSFIFKLNGFLPKDIYVKRIFRVSDSAHARFDAISRTYHYFISQEKDPFLNDVFFLYQKINVQAMNEASCFLLGEHDFTSFSKSKSQTFTNNCNVIEAFWTQKENQLIFKIKANRFLRNMVRAIVGTLLQVGKGKISPKIIKKIITDKNRKNAGPSVPSSGLFLTEIDYPDNIFYEQK